MTKNAQPFHSKLILARDTGADAVADLLSGFRDYLQLVATAAIPHTHRSRLDASGVVQDTLVKASDHFQEFRGITEAELASWLRTTLNRTLIDAFRKLGAAKSPDPARVKSVEALIGDGSRIYQNLLEASGTSPSMKADRNETAMILAKAMTMLPDDYRIVLNLRSIEERSWQEVADRMDRTLGSVRMLWTRALVQLRPLLEDAVHD